MSRMISEDPKAPGKRRSKATRRRWTWALLVSVVISVGADCPSKSKPPKITKMSSAAGEVNSGSAGDVIRVEGENFGVGGTIFFDGKKVATQGASSPLMFTVPYDQKKGTYKVYVEVDSHKSPEVDFKVLFAGTASKPQLRDFEDLKIPFDDFEVGYFTVVNRAAPTMMELVIYGSFFDTNCVVMFGGNEITRSYLPGLSPDSLAAHLRFGHSMIDYPQRFDGEAIVAVLTKDDGNLPTPGKTYKVRVKNKVTSERSSEVSITIPKRTAMVEIDRVETVRELPTIVRWNNRLHTLRKVFTQAGILVDLRYDEDGLKALPAYSKAQAKAFYDANSTLRYETFAGQWYLYLALLTKSSEIVGATEHGRLIQDSNGRRLATAVYADHIPSRHLDQHYLRTAIHELGHQLNLTHCEGEEDSSKGMSIMKQTADLRNQRWGFFFSKASVQHLRDHPDNEVMPGPGGMAYNSSQRRKGNCNR